jgi:hypothetical protein
MRGRSRGALCAHPARCALSEPDMSINMLCRPDPGQFKCYCTGEPVPAGCHRALCWHPVGKITQAAEHTSCTYTHQLRDIRVGLESSKSLRSLGNFWTNVFRFCLAGLCSDTTAAAVLRRLRPEKKWERHGRKRAATQICQESRKKTRAQDLTVLRLARDRDALVSPPVFLADLIYVAARFPRGAPKITLMSNLPQGFPNRPCWFHFP